MLCICIFFKIKSHRNSTETMLVWLPKGLFSHIFDYSYGSKMGCPGGLAVKKKKKKKSACNAGEAAGLAGSVPGLGRSPGEGNGNALHFYCLENPTDRGAWWAMVHRIKENWTGLSD